MSAMDLRQGSIKCEICGVGFVNMAVLKEHKNNHGDYMCSICSEFFSTAFILEDHQLTVHNKIDPNFYVYVMDSGYKCFCNKQYKDKTFLAEHMRESHSCFICILGQGVRCNIIFKNRIGLELHQKQCHPYNPQLDKKNSTSGEPINKNVRKAFDDMEIINVDCDLTGESTEVPTKVVAEVINVDCDLTGESPEVPSKVVAEAETVKKTEEQKSLQALMNTATYLYRNEYKCFCKKQFQDRTLLAKHLKESRICHNFFIGVLGQGNTKCFCKKQYKNKTFLAEHMRESHNCFICVLGQGVSCNTIFKNRYCLELHQKQCHPYPQLDKKKSTSGKPNNKNVRKDSDDMEIIDVDCDLTGESPEVPTKVVGEAETVKNLSLKTLLDMKRSFYVSQEIPNKWNYYNNPYMCLLCDKQFSNISTLNAHQDKIHGQFLTQVYNKDITQSNRVKSQTPNDSTQSNRVKSQTPNSANQRNSDRSYHSKVLSSSNVPQVLRRSSREHKAVNRTFPGVDVDSMPKSSGDTCLEVDNNIVSDGTGIGNDDGGLVDNDNKSDYDDDQDSDWSIGSSSSNDSKFRPKTISGKNKSPKLVSNSSNVEGHVSNEMSSARRTTAMSCGVKQSDTEPIEVDIHELANYGLYFGCTDCHATFQPIIDAVKHHMECHKVSSIPKQSRQNNTVISDPQQDKVILISEDGMRDGPVSFDNSTANNKSLSGDRYDMECDNIPVDPHDDVVESDFDEDDDLQVEGSEQPGANTLLLNSDVHAMRLNYGSSLSDSFSAPDDSILASQTTAVSTPLDHDSQPPRYGIINIKTELENDYGDSVYTNMTSPALTESVTIKQEPTFLKIEKKLMSTLDSDCTSSVRSKSANNVATPLNIVQNVHTVCFPNVQLAADKRVNSDPSF